MKYLTCISKSLKSVYMILCIRKRAYQVFIYMFRFWDYFQFICDVKQRIR